MGHWKKKKKRMSSGMNTPARGHGPSIRLKKGICMPNFPVQAAAAADADGAGVEVSWNQSSHRLASSIKEMHALPNERINNALQVAMLCIDRAMDDQRQVFPLLASFVVSTPLMAELILY